MAATRIAIQEIIVARGLAPGDAQALANALPVHVLLVNLADGQTLESLDEEAMAAAGWVRKQTSKLQLP